MVLVYNFIASSKIFQCIPLLKNAFPINIIDSFSTFYEVLRIPESSSIASLHVLYSLFRVALSIRLLAMSQCSAISSNCKSCTQVLSPYSIQELAAELTRFLARQEESPFPLSTKLVIAIAFFLAISYWRIRCLSHLPFS